MIDKLLAVVDDPATREKLATALLELDGDALPSPQTTNVSGSNPASATVKDKGMPGTAA